MSARARNRRHFTELSLLVVAMFGFGYALVPLYDVICDLTGLNGKNSAMAVDPAALPALDPARTVTVEFVTTVNGGSDWKFAPLESKVRVHPGQVYSLDFVATNPRDEPMVAQAVPSISPWRAAKYLRKTECFCFNQQPFGAREEKRMPVKFVLDPDLPADVDTVTLSYTFFELEHVAHAPQTPGK